MEDEVSRTWAHMRIRKLPAGFSEEYLKKKSPAGKLGLTWEGNIKMDLEEI